MLNKPLIFFDKIYLYAKNLEQEYDHELIQQFKPISKDKKVGYNIIETSNDKIKPVSDLTSGNQKFVIFDYFVTERNQKPLIDYFIQGRHKTFSVIYLSQSYYKTPKCIRLNCSHMVLYEFPSNNEVNLISRENGIDKDKYKRATFQPYSFLYIDKPKNVF